MTHFKTFYLIWRLRFVIFSILVYYLMIVFLAVTLPPQRFIKSFIKASFKLSFWLPLQKRLNVDSDLKVWKKKFSKLCF